MTEFDPTKANDSPASGGVVGTGPMTMTTAAAVSAQPETLEVEVHTMPDRFAPGRGSSGGSGKPGRRWVIVAALVLLLLVGGAVGAYFYLNLGPNPFMPKPLPASNNQVPVNTNTTATPNTNATNEPANSNVSNTNISNDTPEGRDQQRISDVSVLVKALDQYYVKYGSYPQFLSAIPQDILPVIPSDPSTRSPYTYGPRENKQSYVIIMDVEKGVSFKGEFLTARSYEVSPEQNVNPVGEPGTTPPPSTAGNIDSDGDGLTASEEQLFKTSAFNTDTDADGYQDNVEIGNYYSPINSGNVTLEQAGLIKRYTDSTLGYSFYYPSTWVASTVGGIEREVLVTATTGEDFSIKVVDNVKNQTAWEWYAENISFDFNPQNVEMTKVAGQDAVRSLNGLGAYFSYGSYIYSIEYKLKSTETVDYPNVFTSLLNRFSLGS